jgi:hypothetical protein
MRDVKTQLGHLSIDIFFRPQVPFQKQLKLFL